MGDRATFGAPPYVEAEVRGVDGDHVDVVAAGRQRRFAIGHLPPLLTALLIPGTRCGIHVADDRTMTMLGPIEGEAIVDIRDPEPMVCPVALAILRTHAPDAKRTLREFAAASALIAGTNGMERSHLNGTMLSYGTVDRALTIGYESDDSVFEAGAVIVRSEIPQTIVTAGVGRPLSDIVDHPFLRGVRATISSLEVDAGTTRIGWSAPAMRVRTAIEVL